jgi:hypothetical protein
VVGGAVMVVIGLMYVARGQRVAAVVRSQPAE